MAAFIVTGQPIPDEQFSCPSNGSGTDFVTIPWSNMSVNVLRPGANVSYEGYNDEYCGIKGPHPRMAYCCQYGQLSSSPSPDAAIALAQSDGCSQYCPFFLADMNLWLYCLTQEGDTVTNAFCRLDGGVHLSTSGSVPRDGPFDPNSQVIKDKKNKYSSYESAASTARSSTMAVYAGLAVVLTSWLADNSA